MAVNIVAVSNYALTSKIGNGNFGVVYKGVNLKTKEPVAIKLEKRTQYSLLKHETTILNHLYSKDCRNIPPIYWYGKVENYSALVIPYYPDTLPRYLENKSDTDGRPISDYMNSIMRSFIGILEKIHGAWVVHRDLKPDNWMVRHLFDRSSPPELILIDFGLAAFYMDADLKHIPFRTDKPHIVGTPKYVSYNIHCGCEYGRRDDLISIGYIAMELYMNKLDLWDTLTIYFDLHDMTNVEHPKNKLLKTKKELANIHRLCIEWPEIHEYMDLVYNMEYQQTPNYSKLADIFGTRGKEYDCLMSNCKA